MAFQRRTWPGWGLIPRKRSEKNSRSHLAASKSSPKAVFAQNPAGKSLKRAVEARSEAFRVPCRDSSDLVTQIGRRQEGVLGLELGVLALDQVGRRRMPTAGQELGQVEHEIALLGALRRAIEDDLGR